MNIVSTIPAASLGAPTPASMNNAEAIYQAATLLLPFLEQGKPITTATLRTAMTTSFGGSDAQGLWVWKEGYEALEVAQVLFLRRFDPAILSRSTKPQATLAMIKRIADLLPTHTRRSHGAQSHVLAVARKDRIRPLSLVDALAIVRAEPQSALRVNTRSNRAAIQLPTASLMLDDGAIEQRVRLLRPTDEMRFGPNALAETHWEPADRKLFCDLWQAEVAAVPKFTTSTFHIVTGLLLAIWRRVPDHDCQVYRIQTDAGERIIGRHIAPTLVATMLRNLGLDHVPALAPQDAWTGLVEGRVGLQLADGLILRRSRIMNDYRIELIGFTDALVPRLKALGLISEASPGSSGCSSRRASKGRPSSPRSLTATHWLASPTARQWREGRRS